MTPSGRIGILKNGRAPLTEAARKRRSVECGRAQREGREGGCRGGHLLEKMLYDNAQLIRADADGYTLVLTHEDSPQALALNRLDDTFSGSPAAVGRELFLRGERHLYCIAEDSQE